MKRINFLSIILLIISVLTLKVAFGGVVGSRNSSANFRQDEPGGESSANEIEGEQNAAENGAANENDIVRQDDGEGEESPAEGGGGEGSETTTVDPETLKGPDRFLYGWAALVKATDILFQEIIDKKVEQKVKLLEDFLNLIHDVVHVDGPEDYHETAYITMKQEKRSSFK